MSVDQFQTVFQSKVCCLISCSIAEQYTLMCSLMPDCVDYFKIVGQKWYHLCFIAYLFYLLKWNLKLSLGSWVIAAGRAAKIATGP